METPDTDLPPSEQEEVEAHLRLRSPVVYEIVRQEGEAELARPATSLWWSGFAAGIAISASLLAEALLHHYLPDVPWRPLVENFGYCVGFLIVILARLQLFTENTITAVLPLLADLRMRRLWQTARLWGIVFLANMVGTFFTAVFATEIGTVPDVFMPAMLEISHHFADKSVIETFLHAIPAGFFVAAIVWILPSAEGSEFWVIVVLTYLIALGDFSHVVAGSTEVFLLILTGDLTVIGGIAELIVPALAGNIIGGTGLFAILAYAQVREEMPRS